MQTDYYFEDFKVGDQHPSISYSVDKEEVIDFAKKWDPQPWHIDEQAAAESIFGGLTACSAHIFSIFCITSQNWLESGKQHVVASLGFDKLRTLKPVYVGDTIHCVSTVKDTRVSDSRPGVGIIVCQCELFNQQSDTVFSTESAFLMSMKPGD